jgi:hypothetical protein
VLDEWLDACLAAAGRERTGPVQTVRERPWATIRRAPTTAGTVWVKQCSAANAFEAGLYALLQDVSPQRILVPLGVDLERGWLLLPDGGTPLADLAGGEARIAALVRILPQYAELQRALAPRVDDLLGLGIADMRPAAMPARYEEALVKIGMPPPVGAERFAGWCDELAAAPGDASLDHNDLHGDNMLPDPDGSVRFYDWGDAVVAHPFASMLMGLGVIRYIHGCPDDDPRITWPRDAYLEAFSDLAPHAELVHALELACRVAKVARALVWHRAVEAFPDADPQWADAPAESLTALADASYLTGA